MNAIYLYDDKVLLTFNYKEGTKTISLDDVAFLAVSGESGSDLGCLAPPNESPGAISSGVFVWPGHSRGGLVRVLYCCEAEARPADETA